jgi:hypothetical protein
LAQNLQTAGADGSFRGTCCHTAESITSTEA